VAPRYSVPKWSKGDLIVTYWQEQLTKEERDHLSQKANVVSLSAFKRTHAVHEISRKEHPDYPDPCLICKGIARKLGLEVT